MTGHESKPRASRPMTEPERVEDTYQRWCWFRHKYKWDAPRLGEWQEVDPYSLKRRTFKAQTQIGTCIVCGKSKSRMA